MIPHQSGLGCKITIFRVSPEPFGVGVYLLASILDHSCNPTCAAIFNGRQVQVMALQRIPPGSITTMATISYISPMEDRQTRERQQRRIWHFSCTCSLCKEGSLVDLQKHSLACRSEGCEGGRPILFGADEDEEKQEEEIREDFEQLEDKVCTDVVEVEEGEDAEDAEVLVLVEVDDNEDAEVKVDKNNIKIVEVEVGKENADDDVVEMGEVMPGSYTRALPCWHCGDTSEVGEQVREVQECE